jgi:uncharacterized protein YfaS (alpha-2-macroglobulin family)
MKKWVMLAVWAMMAGSAVSMPAPQPLEITRITPDGQDVPTGRQIVLQFNRPVVPIGAMERDSKDIPITIEPPLDCEWRWLNSSALACNLGDKDALKPATHYHLTIHQGITAEDGATIPSTIHHRFITQRADIEDVYFKEWITPEQPLFQLRFSQAVTDVSVREAVFFTYAGSTVLQPVKVMPHPEDTDAPKHTAEGTEARSLWLVQPEKPLPSDSDAVLQLNAGLVSVEGREKSAHTRELRAFHTLPAFAFLGVKCYTNEDDSTPVIITNTQNQEVLCNPMRGASLLFSSPVMRSQIKQHLRFSPPLLLDGGVDSWGEVRDYSGRGYLQEKDKPYEIWLPAGIKAASTYHITTPDHARSWWQRLWVWMMSWFRDVTEIQLSDEFGRSLDAPIDIKFSTNHRKPNFEIIHHDAVLEKQSESDVPLYVNNLERTTLDYRRITVHSTKEGQSYSHDFPKIMDKQFAIPMQVRDMLEGKSGVVVGSLSTQPAVVKGGSAHRVFAQVTPYMVQAKLGHFNSAVWVVDFASGAPVAGAKVMIYRDSIAGLHTPSADEIVTHATTDDAGIAYLEGTDTLDPLLSLQRNWNDHEERLFVRVEKEGEMAVLPLTYHYQTGSYSSIGESVYPDTQVRHGHMKAWGMTAQGVYRAGDTIQYKLYVRAQDNKSFIAPPQKGYHLTITDPTGKVVHTQKEVTLNAFGAYAGEFTTSKQAAVGWYQFALQADFAKRRNWEGEEQPLEWQPMRVLVSDFTPSPFKVSTQLHGELFAPSQELEVTTHASLHSGGAYGEAAVRVTGLLQSRAFAPTHPVSKNFSFGSYKGQADQQQLFQKIANVNEKGEHVLKATLTEQSVYYGRIMVESAVQDERGKYVTATSYADYAGVDRFIGLRMREWMANAGKNTSIDWIVTDAKGAPVADTQMQLTIEKEEVTAARVKGAGNAYITEYHTTWAMVAECSKTSALNAQSCDFTPKDAGYYRATATIKDTQGRPHQSELYLYVVGDGYVLWNTDDEHALEIIPEKTEYKVGDTARYLIKNPYPDAHALVTIERYGVLHHFVQKLKGSAPMVEFEVKPDYLPGFYLSVTVFSPRVDKPIEGQVDLGKPTFKRGYATVNVNDPHKTMLVEVKADKKVYRPREKVTLSLRATPKMQDKKEPIELAVAVVDESVFDLIAGGTGYYDPYRGFYQLDSLDVQNYSLLMRLVGRQKFEKKGANQGGDGGVDVAMRNLFKFVSYWNPSVLTDEQGAATVQFDVPDNLTGWRVLAMAVTPSDRMGLGEGQFKVNRPTEIRPVMPNGVHEGDSFEAGFSVMNRTDKERTITVDVSAEGAVQAENGVNSLQRTITLAPYKRSVVTIPVTAAMIAHDDPAGEIRFTVEAVDGEDGDAITHTIPVYKRRSLHTSVEYGSTTEARSEQSLKVPADIYTDVGGIDVTLSPSVIGNVEGAFRYMRDYPYACWEQRLTKAVMAMHYEGLRSYLPKALEWDEAKTLPERTLQAAADFQAPNGGMAYFVATDSHADPYLSAYTALAFEWLRAKGYTPPEAMEQKLHGYLQGLLKHDAFPTLYDAEMKETLRAVILAALAPHGKVSQSDIQRLSPHLPQMRLFGKIAYVQAALQVENADNEALNGIKALLSHTQQSAGKFSLNQQAKDGDAQFLSTPLRENCAALSLFTRITKRHPAYGLVQDVPLKLVRNIVAARGSRDHFENTQENMFCMQGLLDYATRYEATTPQMQVSAALNDASIGTAHFADVKDAPVSLHSPFTEEQVGQPQRMTLTKEGQGRYYYATRLSYAPKVEPLEAINAGMQITREYSVQRGEKWELVKDGTRLKQGDVVRVDIYLSLPTARHFVVVSDPVAGGLEPVNRQLATASQLDADKAMMEAAEGSWWFKEADWTGYQQGQWGFYHQELRHDVARFYADYLPAGNYHLSYTEQVIAAGIFAAPATHVEEMYDPDVYGKGLSTSIHSDK